MTNREATAAAQVPLLTCFSEVAERYDALLCDVWGVLHNGVDAYPRIVEALTRYKATGGRVLLLSNAPRPGVGIPAQLERLGIPAEAYDGVVTSGDGTRASLASGEHGQKYFHIGPERDFPTFEDLDNLQQVTEEEAEFILCTGLFDDDTETADDYADMLARIRQRDLDLVCANPDIVVDRGDRRVYCGGAIAAAYSELGGRSHYYGKPHAPIYELAQRRLAEILGRTVPKERLLAVGDGLMTDIKGANAQGIDALFITGGIAWEKCGPSVEEADARMVTELCAEQGVSPIAAMPRLIWN